MGLEKDANEAENIWEYCIGKAIKAEIFSNFQSNHTCQVVALIGCKNIDLAHYHTLFWSPLVRRTGKNPGIISSFLSAEFGA